jgi:hypothetical protein
MFMEIARFLAVCKDKVVVVKKRLHFPANETKANWMQNTRIGIGTIVTGLGEISPRG